MTDVWGTRRPRHGLAPAQKALLAALAAFGLVGFSLCGWVALQIGAGVVDLPVNRVEVAVATQAEATDDRITVTGTTNLPDGTVLDWWIEADPRLPIYANHPIASGEVTVAGGAFEFSTDRAGWQGTAINAHIELYVDSNEQPANVTDRLGAWGERMHGPDVYSDSGDKYLWIDVPIDLRRP